MSKPKIVDPDFVNVEALKADNAILKRENRAATLTIEKLLEAANKKLEEITHLKELLAAQVPVIQSATPLVKASVSAEEEIAEVQLERLRTASKGRALTLEETRMYDMLVKNKRLSQEQSTINLNRAEYRDVSPQKLIEIALSSDSED